MNLRKVNKIAAKSLSANTKSRILRHYYRQKLYRISRRNEDFDYREKNARRFGPIADREPWPFSDPGFCPWEEDDSNEHYTLVPNPAGFVTGHPTAYCSAMIYVTTDKWPTIKSFSGCDDPDAVLFAKKHWVTSEHKFDAKNWVSFLALNGFRTIVDQPEVGHRYVGVNPYLGEFGAVVWFHGLTDDGKMARVSTRLHKRFFAGNVPINDYIWVQIL